MFNIGSGEIALIAVVALLVLGPKGLPELARGIGKFLREFRRQTDSVRNIVEREFYQMDQDIHPDPVIAPPSDSVAKAIDPGHDANGALLALPLVTEEVHSQLTAGAPGALTVDPNPSAEESSAPAPSAPMHSADAPAAAVAPESSPDAPAAAVAPESSAHALEAPSQAPVVAAPEKP
jgi:sec-independent protein translocase protein TatB